jgi:hypothetical protein
MGLWLFWREIFEVGSEKDVDSPNFKRGASFQTVTPSRQGPHALPIRV